MIVRKRLSVAAGFALAVSVASTALAGNPDWKRAYDAGLIGGAYGAGEAIGAAAVSGQGGYDGGTPVGYGGGPSGPADRPCYARRPVYDENGTMIGYRGRQFC